MKQLRILMTILMIVPLLTANVKEENSHDSHRNRKSHKRPIRLSDELLEISGLVYYQGAYFALNDGGPDSHLYVMDSLGSIVRKIFVEAQNTDWEALTIGDGKLFIGDVGNNFGKRSKLRILEIDLRQLETDTIRAEHIREISFGTPGMSVRSDYKKHDLDCEAMAYRNGTIHLFSKNRESDLVRHSVLDLLGNDSIAKTVEQISIKGQITDACFDSKGNLLLLGYQPPAYSSFVVHFDKTADDTIFKGAQTRIKLGSFLKFGQSEAICVHPKGFAVIGSEGSSKLNRKARLHRISL
jgi:hypothetical protein